METMSIPDQIADRVRAQSGEYTEYDLDRALAAVATPAAIRTILEEFRRKGLILFDCRGHIVWTHNPDYVRKMLAEPHLRLA